MIALIVYSSSLSEIAKINYVLCYSNYMWENANRNTIASAYIHSETNGHPSHISCADICQCAHALSPAADKIVQLPPVRVRRAFPPALLANGKRRRIVDVTSARVCARQACQLYIYCPISVYWHVPAVLCHTSKHTTHRSRANCKCRLHKMRHAYKQYDIVAYTTY